MADDVNFYELAMMSLETAIRRGEILDARISVQYNASAGSGGMSVRDVMMDRAARTGEAITILPLKRP